MKGVLPAAAGVLFLLLCGGLSLAQFPPDVRKLSPDVCDPEREVLHRGFEQGRIITEPLIACLTRKIESGSLQGAALGFDYGARASMFQLSNQFERAVSDNTRALDLITDSRGANIFLGQRCFALGMLGRFEEALRDCDRAISVEPSFFLLWTYRAATYLKMGENKKALKDYDEALRQLEASPSGNDAVYRYGRGIAKRRLGDKQSGDADVSAALADYPQAPEHYAAWGITE